MEEPTPNILMVEHNSPNAQDPIRLYYANSWRWEWDDFGLTLYREGGLEVVFYPRTAIVSATTILKEEEK